MTKSNLMTHSYVTWLTHVWHVCSCSDWAQGVAVCCSVLQRVAVWHDSFICDMSALAELKVLQCVAACRSVTWDESFNDSSYYKCLGAFIATLQHTATHCNTLQHTATQELNEPQAVRGLQYQMRTDMWETCERHVRDKVGAAGRFELQTSIKLQMRIPNKQFCEVRVSWNLLF